MTDKEGKKRINFFDVSVLLVLVFLLIWFAYNQVTRFISPNIYPGTAIYTLVEDIDNAMRQGFIVNAHVRGIWTMNNSAFNREGVVAKTIPGRIYLILDDGEVITVGGTAAYMEEVAAESIEIYSASESVIKVKTHLLEAENISTLLKEINYLASTLAGKYGVKSYKVEGTIIVGIPGIKPNPRIYQQIISKFEEEPLMGEYYFVMGEDILTAYVKDWREKEILFFNNVIDQLNLSCNEVLTNRLIMYIGTSKQVNPKQGYIDVLKGIEKTKGKIFKDQITIVPSFP